MAEGEDVITDAALHTTAYVQQLWRRHGPPSRRPRPLELGEVARRLELFTTALVGSTFPLRVAQPPAPTTLLTHLFRRRELPRARQALPATDGVTLWLPRTVGATTPAEALSRFRVLAVIQALRARRGSAAAMARLPDPLVRDVYLLLEGLSVEEELASRLPGLRPMVAWLRADALAQRPPLSALDPARRPLEEFARSLLTSQPGLPPLTPPPTPAASVEQAQARAGQLSLDGARAMGASPLFKDLWTGELIPPPPAAAIAEVHPGAPEPQTAAPRSARLVRRPKVREATPDEDDREPGAWMVQTSQPHEHAEDPMGLQRPADRDAEAPPEELADSVSEIAEARLVSTPGRPQEVLLSDDPPAARARAAAQEAAKAEERLRYPEWDYRIAGYTASGVTVHRLPPALGPQAWVDETLERHRPMLRTLQRRFEMLRSQRTRVRKQQDGEEIDLSAYIESRADYAAGRSLSDAVYESHRPARRSLAIYLLIDVSGSTDSWVSEHRRVIDVEREALLLVTVALKGLGAPYAVEAFSGEGPHGVTVRTVKAFAESNDPEIARRIAALEPEHYTRAGAALRHATATLLAEPAHHRLLLLLSDGRPNDVDHYEGRYGVEDLRQAVNEARLQGIHPFCLTIDRQAAGYLPHVFGPRQYALLPQPQLLPAVLVDWMRRLISTGT
ncbi:MAG: VWA domain-containing protein [Myxococcota bacterium]|nr:VWA domain-containing protein [Myxococcota bacterium]